MFMWSVLQLQLYSIAPFKRNNNLALDLDRFHENRSNRFELVEKETHDDRLQ